MNFPGVNARRQWPSVCLASAKAARAWLRSASRPACAPPCPLPAPEPIQVESRELGPRAERQFDQMVMALIAGNVAVSMARAEAPTMVDATARVQLVLLNVAGRLPPRPSLEEHERWSSALAHERFAMTALRDGPHPLPEFVADQVRAAERESGSVFTELLAVRLADR